VYDNNIPNLGAGQTNVELTTVCRASTGSSSICVSPKWRTSIYGGYIEVDYNANATNIINQHLPTPATALRASRGRAWRLEGAVAPADRHQSRRGQTRCSPNFSLVAARFADPVEPASGSRHRRRRAVDAPQHCLQGHHATLGANGARPGGVYLHRRPRTS